jgi:quercetin dioxygenase-like cupin family protein
VWAHPVSDAEYRSAAVDELRRPVARKVAAATLFEQHKADSTFPFNVASATFAPGKRLDWHKDPGGQILVFTAGAGYYQEKGKAKRVVHKGAVIKNVGEEHWHGAASEVGMTHIAITPVGKGATQWLQKVSVQEYGAEPGTSEPEGTQAE